MEWLPVLTAVIAVVAPLGLWFSLGSKIGALQTEIMALKELYQVKLTDLGLRFTDCKLDETKARLDHELRLREVERKIPNKES